MENVRLPIWRSLGAALDAPLSLPSISWKALVVPLLALVGTSSFGLLVGYLRWGATGWLLATLLLLAAAAWLGFEFQRHLLLGAATCRTELRNWRRYGLYFLAMVVVLLSLSVIAGVTLFVSYAALGWFQGAVRGSGAWLFAGGTVLGFVALGAIVYSFARLMLTLPALAVGHAAGPARIWRYSRSNGWRLVTLLLVIPGCAHGLFDFLLPHLDTQMATLATAVLFDAYLSLVHLALLAQAYRSLSGETLPAPSGVEAAPPFRFSRRLVRSGAALALIGVLGFGLWDAVYRVEPGETSMILRLGKPKRIDSEPGFGLKLPLIEDVRPVSRSASHRSEGEGRFLTVSKESLSLTYRTRWRVTDPEVFFIATGGHVQSANARIDSLATDLLRHRVAELSMVELRQLRQSGSTHSGLDDQAQASGLLGDVLEKANDRTADLGIEITHWRVDVVAERAG